jgi:hypothetical protein
MRRQNAGVAAVLLCEGRPCHWACTQEAQRTLVHSGADCLLPLQGGKLRAAELPFSPIDLSTPATEDGFLLQQCWSKAPSWSKATHPCRPSCRRSQ